MSWSGLDDWWRSEIASDPAYEEVITPLLLEVLRPRPRHRYLDLGCGEGRVMRALKKRGVQVDGLDSSADLARSAPLAVVALLPDIPMKDSSYDGVYSVLAVEHVEDHEGLFREAARVTKSGGVMALVMNHPTWTAPGSTPIADQSGEVLWRPGEYFSRGQSDMPAGDGSVTFFHRPMSELLNAAASASWCLEHTVEQPHHSLVSQAGIPRLLAGLWRKP